MLVVHDGRSYPHRSHWVDLQEEIVDLFEEEQTKILYSASFQPRLVKALQRSAQGWRNRKRIGWNTKTREPHFYAKQSAKYRNWKIPKLEAPFNPKIYCYGCSYQAHTPAQFKMHMHCTHGPGRANLAYAKRCLFEKQRKQREAQQAMLERQADVLLQASGF